MHSQAGHTRGDPRPESHTHGAGEEALIALLQSSNTSWLDDISVEGSSVRARISQMRSIGREWALAAWGRFYSYGEIEHEDWLGALDTLFA